MNVIFKACALFLSLSLTHTHTHTRARARARTCSIFSYYIFTFLHLSDQISIQDLYNLLISKKKKINLTKCKIQPKNLDQVKSICINSSSIAV